jgi:hypothetical protein
MKTFHCGLRGISLQVSGSLNFLKIFCHSPSNAFKFSTELEQTVGFCVLLVGSIVGIWNYAHWLKFEKLI